MPDESSDKPSRQISLRANVEWTDDSLVADVTPNSQKVKDSKTMSLEDLRTAYFEASKKVSESVRQLGLAGIGLIWVFKGSAQNAMSLDPKLMAAALCIMISIGLDFLQYVYTTYVWYFYYRHKEKKNPDLAQQFLVSPKFNWPNFSLFFLKVLGLSVAYGRYILPYLWWRIHR